MKLRFLVVFLSGALTSFLSPAAAAAAMAVGDAAAPARSPETTQRLSIEIPLPDNIGELPPEVFLKPPRAFELALVESAVAIAAEHGFKVRLEVQINWYEVFCWENDDLKGIDSSYFKDLLNGCFELLKNYPRLKGRRDLGPQVQAILSLIDLVCLREKSSAVVAGLPAKMLFMSRPVDIIQLWINYQTFLGVEFKDFRIVRLAVETVLLQAISDACKEKKA